MKKSLILAAIALSLGTGAAMAQEGDAQYLAPNAVPHATTQQAPIAVNRTYSVQTHQIPAYLDPGQVSGGSDGGGN